MAENKKKKKILFVYHVSSIGGGSYCLLNILKEVDKEKFFPIILLRSEGPLCDEVRKLGIAIYFLGSLSTVPYNKTLFKLNSFKSIVNILLSLYPYIKLLKRISPDVVYVNTMMLYPYLFIAKHIGFKTVIHIREHWDTHEHKFQRMLAVNAIRNYANHVIAINDYSASIINDDKIRCTVIYDWIEMEKRYLKFPLNEILNIPIGTKIYLYTGGLQGIKGVMEIVSVFTSKIHGNDKALILMGVQELREAVGLRYYINKILSCIGKKTYSQKLFDIINSDSRIYCLDSTYYIKDIIDQSYCLVSYFTIPHANLSLAEFVIEKIPSVAARTEESMEYSLNGELASLFEINNLLDFTSKWEEIDSRYNNIKNNLNEKSIIIKNKFDKERNVCELNRILDHL